MSELSLLSGGRPDFASASADGAHLGRADLAAEYHLA
jgi:hypothetical protein